MVVLAYWTPPNSQKLAFWTTFVIFEILVKNQKSVDVCHRAIPHLQLQVSIPKLCKNLRKLCIGPGGPPLARVDPNYPLISLITPQ